MRPSARALAGLAPLAIAVATGLAGVDFGYHSRFVAPGAVVAMFGALALFGAVMAQKEGGARRWLRLGAIGASLATSTKYPAGLLLLPVLLAAFLAPPKEVRRRVRIVAAA